MVNSFVHLIVRKDTKDLLLGACADELRKYHPEWENRPIPQDILVKALEKFYLNIPYHAKFQSKRNNSKNK